MTHWIIQYRDSLLYVVYALVSVGFIAWLHRSAKARAAEEIGFIEQGRQLFRDGYRVLPYPHCDTWEDAARNRGWLEARQEAAHGTAEE